MSSSRPTKRVRRSETQLKMDAAGVVEEVLESCAPTWSCTNLVAVATRSQSQSELNVDSPGASASAPLSITLTHFGLPASSASSSSSAKRTARLSFTLSVPVPATARPARISRLAFSPCGGYLLAVRTSEREGDSSDSLVVFEQKDACINLWDIVWNESVAAFGDGERVQERKTVVQLRFIGEPRNWYPAPDVREGCDYDPPTRSLYCSPKRSPPVVGMACILVLSSSELLFIHLPRTTPLIPLTALLPLTSHASITARPTPPTSSTSATSPQNTLDDLVSNLVDVMPDNGPSPSVVVGALGLVQGGDSDADAGTGRGMGAMREELEAAKERKERGEKARKSITMASVGTSRAKSTSMEIGFTRMLVATVSASTSLTPPAATTPPRTQLDALGLVETLNLVPLAADAVETPDFNMDSFLDDAFGGEEDKPDKKDDEGVGVTVAARRKATESGERVVDLCEAKVEMAAQDGPRLSLRPLPPLHLFDPADLDTSSQGTLTHLAWLEDIELPPPNLVVPAPPEHPTKGTTPEAAKAEVLKFEAALTSWRHLIAAREAKEAGLDLRLLAVVAAPNIEGYQSSAMTTWAFSSPLYPLSEAFASLECKKADVSVGSCEWSTRRAASRNFDGLVSLVLPSDGPALGSFVAGITTRDNEGGGERTVVVNINSTTLETRTDDGETKLPGNHYYASAAISTNRSLICATPFGGDLVSRPVMAAVPLALDESSLPNALGVRIAMALVRQVDPSDLVGRVTTLKSDTFTVATARTIRDTLQGVLPPDVQLSGTPLQIELLGVISSMYRPSDTLALRASVAYDVVQLASCLRAFEKCEKKSRNGGVGRYECESDAIWPLVGHLTWYCDFCRELLKECNTSLLFPSNNESNPRLVLLLHPLSRGILLRTVECILDLQSFLGAFPIHSNVTVDVSRSVLDDVINYNGLVMREWLGSLVRIGELSGISGVEDSSELRDLLVDFIIPPSLSTPTAILSALISIPSLLLSRPPTPPSTPLEDASDGLDIMRRGRRSSVGQFKECTMCGGRTEKKGANFMEPGKWAGVEMTWEGRCVCGGLWVAKSSS